jgi:regulatory protein
VERGFIDEERYCRAFVKDKVVYNKWGRRKVEQALWAKRIPQEIIREALDEVDQENYVDTLRQLLKNKSRSVKASSEYERTQKLIRFAAGRGFTMDVIRQCLNTDYDEDDC